MRIKARWVQVVSYKAPKMHFLSSYYGKSPTKGAFAQTDLFGVVLVPVAPQCDCASGKCQEGQEQCDQSQSGVATRTGVRYTRGEDVSPTTYSGGLGTQDITIIVIIV